MGVDPVKKKRTAAIVIAVPAATVPAAWIEVKITVAADIAGIERGRNHTHFGKYDCAKSDQHSNQHRERNQEHEHTLQCFIHTGCRPSHVFPLRRDNRKQ
jgi:ABC-type nickel/cobalt efflux system permease component RcnA